MLRGKTKGECVAHFVHSVVQKNWMRVKVFLRVNNTGKLLARTKVAGRELLVKPDILVIGLTKKRKNLLVEIRS